MSANRFTSAFRISFLTAASILLLTLTAFQTILPAPAVPRSLFDEDTCAPPCWFGLTANESINRNVLVVLKGSEQLLLWDTDYPTNVFDPQTGYLIEGWYNIVWREYEREDGSQIQSRIHIHHGKVVDMRIVMNKYVTLEQTLERLGMPDHVYFFVGDYALPYLSLIYLDWSLRVELTSSSHQSLYRP
jgi:hypothetical protein